MEHDLGALLLLGTKDRDKLRTVEQVLGNNLQHPRSSTDMVQLLDQETDVVEPLWGDIVDGDDQPPPGQLARTG